MRRFAASHPLLTAAVGGAIVGLMGAVLLLRFGDPPGVGTFTRSQSIFAVMSVPASGWYRIVFGWSWNGSRASEFLTLLSVNGAVWAAGLTVLARRLRRSATARRIAGGSALAGTVLAVLVWMVGMPVMDAWDGPEGLILLAQLPGVFLLAINGYDTIWYDGTFMDEIYRPGPATLLMFSLANALLIAGLVRVARFTWRWLRTPMPRRHPVEQG